MTRAQPILLVEDDESDVILLCRTMGVEGILSEVMSVGDGEDALDFLRHRGAYSDPAAFPRPCLILLDLKMPKMGGLELISILQLDPRLKDIPVVILTGSDDPSDREIALARGASAFLVKPASAKQILGAATSAGVDLAVASGSSVDPV